MTTVSVEIEFLKEVLRELEDDWETIDSDRGPYPGGLEGAIRDGQAETIKKLRTILSDSR